MGKQRSGVRRVAQISVKSCAYELMIALDNDRAGKVFAEIADCNCADCKTQNQERQTTQTDYERCGLHATNADKPEYHSDQLNGIHRIPKLGRVFVPMLLRLDSITKEIGILKNDPQ